jgi:pyridoxine 5'-phosphate synthase PdxJ
MRLGLNFNPFLKLNKHMPFVSYGVHHLVSISEIEQIDAISFYFSKSYSFFSSKEALLISALSHKFLNIHVNSDSNEFMEILEAKPKMLTFVSGINEATLDIEPVLQINSMDYYSHSIDRIKSSGILTAIKIKPDINIVRKLAKLPFDYLEFDTSEINSAQNLLEENEFIDKLRLAVLAADKYNFGIVVSGLISHETIHRLKEIPQIEEAYTSKHFFERTLIRGLEKTIKEYVISFK